MFQVNTVSTVKRDDVAMKQKFTDLKSRTKKKATAILRVRDGTGGGEVDLTKLSMAEIEAKLDSMATFEKRLVATAGKEWLLGFDSGYDTSANDSSLPPTSPNEIVIVEHLLVNSNFSNVFQVNVEMRLIYAFFLALGW